MIRVSLSSKESSYYDIVVVDYKPAYVVSGESYLGLEALIKGISEHMGGHLYTAKRIEATINVINSLSKDEMITDIYTLRDNKYTGMTGIPIDDVHPNIVKAVALVRHDLYEYFYPLEREYCLLGMDYNWLITQETDLAKQILKESDINMLKTRNVKNEKD